MKASPWDIFWPKNPALSIDAVYVASFPKVIYFWPCLILFPICALLQMLTDIDPASIGWWVIGGFAFNFLVVVRDFDQKKFVILVLVIATMLLGGWIVNLKGLDYIKNLFGWLGTLNPTIGTHTLMILFVIFGFFFLWGIVTSRFNYWRLEHNEFVHYVQPVGRDQSFAREGHSVTKEVPDVLEYLLTFGGGTIVIKQGDSEVARIPDVPFLSRRMVAIEQMLGVRKVKLV